MPSHIFNSRKDILLPPVSVADLRGMSKEELQVERKAVNLKWWKESKIRRTGDFKLKNNSHYFENQRRFQLLKR